jgi:CheY-like chemotaxis protein
VAIYRILQNTAFDPDRIELVAKAYEDTLRSLNLVDRSDPLTELIAKEIFEAAQRGERDPDRLRQTAITSLGLTSPSAVRNAEPDNAPHPTVLIVEDDDAFAYAASRHFQKLGYSTVVASGSLSALQELERQSVDVVITDVRLKDDEPHGVALARMIRNRDRAMPVLLVTGYPEMVEREQPLPGQVFVKPVELDALAMAVQASLVRSVA